MRTKVIFWFTLLLILNSCHDEQVSFSEGLVTGADFRYCACCGGYFIEIESKTYRFNNDELPKGSIDFDLMDIDTDFPVKVFVVWKLKENSCLGDEILITNITLAD